MSLDSKRPAGVPALAGAAAPPASYVLELPATADFQPGGLGHQCAVSCKAGCCRYYSLPLQAPRSAADFDNVRWYLMHASTHVYKSEGTWYLLVLNECKNLLPNNLCGIYETRPQVCRDYDPTDCEFTGEVKFQEYFETSEQLEAWLVKRKEETARKRAASAAARRVASKAAPKRRRRG